jgi:hypothetical protein
MRTDESPQRRPKAAATKKSASKTSKASVTENQAHVCSAAGCGKVCRSAAGLSAHTRSAHPTPPPSAVIESPAAAVERVLADLDITPRRAVLAATVRELAKALEDCEPTDKAKTSKELTARMADLLADSSTPGDGPDWTEGDEE